MPTERTQRFFEQLSQKFPKAETEEEKRKKAEEMARAARALSGNSPAQASEDTGTTPYQSFDRYIQEKRRKIKEQ